ncbi:MAG: hypothetical protein FWC46_02025 [Actinomycetia bacterium]|nr:hypothetical protein [Actinomycetes bacterium]
MAEDDVDARFRALVDDEFGIRVRGKVIREPGPPTQPYRPADAFSFDAALSSADPTPDESDRFIAPTPGPLHLPRRPIAWVAAALFACPIVVALLHVTGVPLPGWITGGAGLCFGAALALCLFVILPRHTPDPDDGGIRL